VASGGTAAAHGVSVRRNGGFTLIEVMIVVAVIGILAGILVYSFVKPANRVKTSSEVAAMFAELHHAESQYAVEHGVYLSTGAGAADIHPSAPTDQRQDVAPTPSAWDDLHVQPTANTLLCGYVAVAGTADDDLPEFATDFGMEQPARNWYALYARCNADGNSDRDAIYFSSSVDPTTVKRNEGF